MNDQDVYLALSDQFQAINTNLDDLVAAAKSYAQAQAIIASWQQANLNQMQARNRIFAANGSNVQALYEQFVQSERDIRKALSDLKKPAADIMKIASAITAGVNVGKDLLKAGKPVGTGATAAHGAAGM